ncbi:MAG: DUF4197 domain-containing protein [Bacteroidia bacterium]|nr:DUF4197 domain-containing protein [Paludibacter sp.]NCB69120.1 DUF4197 domain-containing protein [Bacteroidia bacterium]
MKKYIFMAALAITFSSCAELMKIAQEVNIPTSSVNIPVTNAENISGLKSSLDVGIEKAVGLLSVENAFYGNEALKILLPAEANQIIENIKLIPGGEDLVNRAVLSLNRSAEDAVKEATPIFKNAIRNMSITDAGNILFGSDSAATAYLRQATYQELKTAFAPKVKASLDKPLLAGVSTSETWNTLSNAYNKVTNTMVAKIAGLKPVNISLEEYATKKALDALFVKVAEEEKAIRTDPVARVNDILKRVFGQLDKK